MGLLQEFKEFAMRGNVVDMAIGIVIGAAFGEIVGSLVKDVIMPPLGAAMAGVDFSALALKIPSRIPGLSEGTTSPPIEIKYGVFLNTIIKFIIVAFALFMVIKLMNTLKKKQESAPPPPPAPAPSEMYLKEIRDLLAKRG